MDARHAIPDRDPANDPVNVPPYVRAAVLVHVLTGRELAELVPTRHDGTQESTGAAS